MHDARCPAPRTPHPVHDARGSGSASAFRSVFGRSGRAAPPGAARLRRTVPSGAARGRLGPPGAAGGRSARGGRIVPPLPRAVTARVRQPPRRNSAGSGNRADARAVSAVLTAAPASHGPGRTILSAGQHLATGLPRAHTASPHGRSVNGDVLPNNGLVTLPGTSPGYWPLCDSRHPGSRKKRVRTAQLRSRPRAVMRGAPVRRRSTTRAIGFESADRTPRVADRTTAFAPRPHTIRRTPPMRRSCATR